MSRLPRPALSLLAGLALVVAACGGTSATPTPTPNPQALLTQAVTKLASADVSSFHLNLDLSGKVNASALGGSSSGLPLSGNMDLAGTNVSGDIDIKNQAADIKFAVPALLSLSGEAILADNTLYYKTSLTGEKFTKQPLSDLASSLGDLGGISGGLPLPSMGANPSVDVSTAMTELQQEIDKLGITITLAPDDQVAGQSAYHFVVNIPIDKINAAMASGGTSSDKLDSASVDFWLYKDTSLPAKLDVKAASSSFGNIEIVLTLSDYNKSVTISAPTADQISEGTPALP